MKKLPGSKLLYILFSLLIVLYSGCRRGSANLSKAQPLPEDTVIEQIVENPPTVIVENAYGAVLVDREVLFEITEGDSILVDEDENEVASLTIFTDLNGRATVPGWKMGPTRIQNTLKATLIGHVNAAPVEFIIQSISQYACPTETELELMNEVNLRRTQNGISPLLIDLRLLEASRKHSEDMATNSFFSHTGSDGSNHTQRMEQADYLNWSRNSEIIAAGQSTPANAVTGWMNSPAHRNIILDTGYLHFGASHVVSTNPEDLYENYYTADFATPEETTDWVSYEEHCL